MLLEREKPLEAMRAVSALAGAGHGRVVVVEGEAGIGKTTLIRVFAEQAARESRIFWGWCEALFTPRPLGPVHDMAAAFPPGISALLEESAAQDKLFPALLQMLQRADNAVILIFEDMHWADNATLDLVRYLGRRIALLPAMLVLSVRSDEVGNDHALRHVLGDLPTSVVTRINLEPLSVESVNRLAEAAGRSPQDLHRITEGNPFFVSELLSGGAQDGRRLPGSIRDAVWSRLSRLSAEVRTLLDTVSITPGGIEPWLVRHLTGEDANHIIDQCLARGLLRLDESGMLTFRHELAREATLERIAPSAQRLLHARMEAALAELPTSQDAAMLSRRVHHADGAGNGERVLELAPRAARQAARLGSHREAAAHHATALRYIGLAGPELAAQLYDEWAYEASLSLRDYPGIIEARHRAIAIWRQLGRHEKISANMRMLSRLYWRQGEGRLAEDFADEAVREAEALPPGPELALAYSTRSQLHMLHYRFDQAVEWGERAIALARRFGETATRVHALNNVGAALMVANRPGGRERLQESLDLSLQHALHDDAARAYTNFSECVALEKDFELAERLLSDGIAYCARYDLDLPAQYLIGRQAQIRLEQGRFREAESIADGVMKQEEVPMVMHLPAMTVLAIVRMRLGDRSSADLLERTLKEGLQTEEPQRIVPVRLAMVEAAWLAEDGAAAEENLAALTAMDLVNFRPWDLGELGVWCRRGGIEVPMSKMTSLPLPRALELAGDPLAASQEWTRLGLPYEAALSALQIMGQMTGPQAEQAIAGAVAVLDRLEARPAAQLARRIARRLGIADRMPRARRGPYSAARHHPLGLTRHEQHVLELIAQGMGNKEIARRMSRSPRTIEHHVSAVLGKFSAANRMEVLLRLRGEPWLLPDSDPPQAAR